MAKTVTPYMRYLLHPCRIWFRAYLLLKIKKRFEFHTGPSRRMRIVFHDGYVLKRRDHIKNKTILMVYDEFFGRWIHIKISSETESYGYN